MRNKQLDNNDELLKHARKALDDSVDNLSDDITDELYAIRRKAIFMQHPIQYKPQDSHGFVFNFRQYLPLTSLALTASIAMGIFIQSGLWQSRDISLKAEIELVSTLENIELYDDFEFYQWLAEEEIQAG